MDWDLPTIPVSVLRKAGAYPLSYVSTTPGERRQVTCVTRWSIDDALAAENARAHLASYFSTEAEFVFFEALAAPPGLPTLDEYFKILERKLSGRDDE